MRTHLIFLAIIVFSSSLALAESACETCTKKAMVETAACQQKLPPAGKTNEEKQARTKAEVKCNEVAKEAMAKCKGACGTK